MKRNVIEIDENKCVGCGLCAGACMQGAIEIVGGKARLMSDSYCDGLGMCLPKCPVDAIKLVEKETESFDPSRKNIKAKPGPAAPQAASPQPIALAAASPSGCGCPGSAQRAIVRESAGSAPDRGPNPQAPAESELMQWPVQLRLIRPDAPYLENADLLVAADCTAFAYGNFHRDFIRGKITAVACPKFDDKQAIVSKLVQILSEGKIRSITVVRMEVPCCAGIVQAVREAMLESRTIVPYSEVTISTDGRIVR